jgi:hypothetical protein
VTATGPRKLLLVVGVLLTPAFLYANPIDISSLPPHPTVLCSLLAEVLVVAALVWSLHLKMLLFFLFWYVVNLFSFFLLLQGFFFMAGLAYPSASSGGVIVAAEVLVISAEAAALYGLTRLPLLQKADSKAISWQWAFFASVLGNITSIVTFPIWAVIPWNRIR